MIDQRRGEGDDRKGGKADGLKWRWSWLMQRELSLMPEKDKRRLPCQTCFARLPRLKGLPGNPYFHLEAVEWHSDYEARVELVGEHILSDKCKTRLEAQLRAEELLKQFLQVSLEMIERKA